MPENAVIREIQLLSVEEQEQDEAHRGEKGQAVVEEEEGDRVSLLLISSDNVHFEVLKSVATQSGMIKKMIDDGRDMRRIPPLPVKAKILKKIIKYWEQHSEDHSDEGDETNVVLKEWDKSFLDMDKALLMEMVDAASILNSAKLFDALCQAVADQIKNLSVEEVRAYFCVENDFTAEEEAKLRSETPWAFAP